MNSALQSDFVPVRLRVGICFCNLKNVNTHVQDAKHSRCYLRLEECVQTALHCATGPGWNQRCDIHTFAAQFLFDEQPQFVVEHRSHHRQVFLRVMNLRTSIPHVPREVPPPQPSIIPVCEKQPTKDLTVDLPCVFRYFSVARQFLQLPYADKV